MHTIEHLCLAASCVCTGKHSPQQRRVSEVDFKATRCGDLPAADLREVGRVVMGLGGV